MQDSYGSRHVHLFRGGPPGYNYNSLKPVEGSKSYNFSTQGMAPDGSDPYIEDLVNGGNIVGTSGLVSHDQVYGPAGTWTKVGMYVRMNSAPGAADGVYSFFLNDQRIYHIGDMVWVGENPENKMVKWNWFSIGGNDYFQPYPNHVKHEEWYAIDDVACYASLPENLK